ncbi:efflux RND transporter permease subunit [Herbiconiux sp. KACC 21604]|uniref:efflux RND transporter permease subunit n=1 Tax=unclassified Herbiconiux TaxID=2618217 RepID=UPI00149127B0|nr:efflux RND transporter permease subunit [Herbiconiux sp. SALV-R1]QJU54828.1 MMPL family transporter [Herbiconiux sp. SALV-R1]WPO85944.1 efflux RND transporter permease subunit [Herbiconiux sp. KACC 21604]
MHFLAVVSMKNRALIALVTIVVAVFGSLALTSLKQELIPSIEFPQLAVLTTYPGASPEVVNDDVSTPIEAAIQGVEGIETTSATSSTNLSIISATFTYGTNLATAEQKMTQAINRIKSTLPEDLDPQVLSGSINDLPIISVAVSNSDADTKALAQQLETTAVPELEDVEGVRAAEILGQIGQRVTITPRAADLAIAGVSATDITDAVKNNGQLIPAGTLTEGGQSYAVQAGKKLASTDDIAALALPAVKADGTPVTIGEVATVALVDDPVTSISRVNGENALTLSVTKLPDANTVEVSRGVQALLPDLEAAIPGATFTVVFDQAPFIEQSIESLATEGLLGLLFAVIVVFVFLLSVRSTLVTAISIPTSVLITFIGLQAADYTLNIITLGALTIAIGRVVDDSIVVIENIKRHLSTLTGTTLPPREAAAARAALIVEAVREVGGAITASTITTVAVFLPLAFVGDTTGELFRPFALTVTIALLASLLVALTIVPVLAYWFVRPPKEKARTGKAAAQSGTATLPDAGVTPTGPATASAHTAEHAGPLLPEDAAVAELAASPGVDAGAVAVATAPPRRARAGSHRADVPDEPPTALQRGYLPIIRWTLRHSVITIAIAAVVLLGTFPLLGLMKTNFLGSSGQNTLTVTQTVPVGASLDAQSAQASEVESALRGIDGIETVQLTIGSSGSTLRDAFVGGGDSAITYNITTDEGADQEALQGEVRTALEAIPDAGEISISSSSGFGASSDIAIDVTAPTQTDLATAADAVLSSMQGLDAVKQASSNLSESRPYVQVAVDRGKAAQAGLSEVAVGALVSQAMQPTTVGTIVIDDTNYTIYLVSEDPPTTEEELAALAVPTVAGPVRLDSLATVGVVDGPATITTVKGVRTATVSVTPNSDDLGTASTEVQQALADVELPPGASAEIGGVVTDQSDAFGQLGIAVLVAILIVYVVMVATFKSLLQPLLLLLSIPFAATGAVALQVISGIPLGVASIIGVLMLVGIVVTNAIVLVDLVNQYRGRGLKVAEALVEGASRRLRPILMTALATIFALLPMAVGLTGHGGFISQPLAIIVIGGLVSSTVLTLIVLPVLYNLVEGFRERLRDRREQRARERIAATRV